MTNKERVFEFICQAQIGTYMTMYYPGDRAVISSRNIAEVLKISTYQTRKALNELKSEGLIEASCMGRPAIESGGEYNELVCEAMPPLRGYSLTAKGFESEKYKRLYTEWEESLKKWGEAK